MSWLKHTKVFMIFKDSFLYTGYIHLRDLCEIIFYFPQRYFKPTKFRPRVLTIEDTIRLVIDKQLSVVRFGDGEFRWMSDIANEHSFQKSSPLLKHRLNNVMNNKNPKLLICIPDVFGSLKDYTYNGQAAWSHLLIHHYDDWIKLLPHIDYYGDSNFTRPYIDQKNKQKSENIFLLIKELMSNRNITIVEGKYTSFGVGNDLLSSANRVRRIICPATNAFESYEEIYQRAIKYNSPNELYLIALGPTATVLSADLCNDGIQAIDIGHLDIEYDWYLINATKRVPLKEKYINELPGSGRIEAQSTDAKYLSEIIDII